MNRAILLAALLGALAWPASGQARDRETRHSFGPRLGLRGSSVRDDLLVPLGFTGGGLDLGLAYRGVFGPGTVGARFELGFSVLSNRFGHLGMTLGHALAVDYLAEVSQGPRWRWALGAVLGESSDSFALQSWDDAHGYWLAATWLGPGVRLLGPLGARWQLEVAGELALAGLVGRPPHFRHNKQDANDTVSYWAFESHADPRLRGPWDFQLLRFDVALRRGPPSARVGRGWSFGLQGRLGHARLPEDVFVIDTVLYAGYAWGAP